MGNRDALLAGAKTCLVERGWSNTTVRDIATAAGVSHAAIGYHFGSRERLLVHALTEAVDELGERLRAQTGSASESPRWEAIVDSFTTDRALWVAQLEALVQAQHQPEVREFLAGAQRRARDGMGGSIPLAVLNGLMVQWLVDPDTALAGDAVVEAAREWLSPNPSD